MSLTERDKKLLTIFAVLLVIGGFWMFLIKPKRAEISDLKTRIDSTEKTLEQTRAQLTRSSVDATQYAENYSENLEMGQAIPTDDAIPSLMVQLDALSGKGVAFSRLQVPKYPNNLITGSVTSTEPAAGTPPGATPAANTAPAPGGTPATSSPATTTPAGSATPPANGTTTPQSPVSGFTPIAVNLQFQSKFGTLQSLFQKIQDLVKVTPKSIRARGRLLFVQGFRIKQGRKSFPNVAVNIGAFAFSIPDAASGAASAGTPTSTPVSAAPTTGQPTPAPAPAGAPAGGTQ